MTRIAEAIQPLHRRVFRFQVEPGLGTPRSFSSREIADTHRAAKDLARVNEFIKSQPEAFLRLGPSRAWQNPKGINGHWMQVNGIYTFPEFFEEIRSYK